MQPNEQDPSQPQAPTPTSVPPGNSGFNNIPDYLHLDPVLGSAGSQPKKSKKILILGLLILIVGLVFVGVATFTWIQGAPERQFYGALQNLMNTTHVKRDGAITQGSVGSAKFTSQTDFSDMSSLKSSMSFSLMKGSTPKDSFDGNIVAMGQSESYIKSESFPSTPVPIGRVANQWYQVATPEVLSKVPLADTLNLRSSINSVFGDTIVGKFGPDTAATLIGYIKSQQIYKITRSYTDKINNVDATAFVIDFSAVSGKVLNKKVAELLKTKSTYVYDAVSDKDGLKIQLTIWIDSQHDQVVRVLNEHKVQNQTFTYQTDYSYPTTVSITAPAASEVKKLVL
jgi:hypothetical protein